MSNNIKNMIADTFVHMVSIKSIDKITVKDLVETCGISRQAFYYHFQDLMEVIEWSVQRAAEETLARVLAIDEPLAAVRIFVDSVADHYALIDKMLHSRRREQVEQIILQSIRTYLQEFLFRHAPEQPVSCAELELSLDFCTCGLVGLLMKHCGKEPFDRDRFARQLYRLLSGQLPGPARP